jgi:hypothetical protein
MTFDIPKLYFTYSVSELTRLRQRCQDHVQCHYFDTPETKAIQQQFKPKRDGFVTKALTLLRSAVKFKNDKKNLKPTDAVTRPKYHEWIELGS